MGVNRFARIGFPLPRVFFLVRGDIWIVCGVLVLFGLWTRLAAPYPCSVVNVRGNRDDETS